MIGAMHPAKHLSICASVILALTTGTSVAQILFQDNFDIDSTSNWSFNSSQFDLADDGINQEANFFFDYSTVGIPPAPGGTLTTRGLKMEANIPDEDGGLFAGASVSPLNLSFEGDYILRFDAWHNFPTSGLGSTQMMGGGIAAFTDKAQFPANVIDGIYFAASSDGGTGTDYRAYKNVGAPELDDSGAYAAGNTLGVRNNTHPYYADFGGNSVPSAQAILFPQQNPAYVSPVGSQGLEWHSVEILKLGNVVTWTIDGKLIATVDATDQLNGTNIFLGLFDINDTTTDLAGRPLNFALFDNVSVTQVVPEASIAGLCLVGFAGLGLRRRHPRCG